jgi:hypothetical protein
MGSRSGVGLLLVVGMVSAGCGKERRFADPEAIEAARDAQDTSINRAQPAAVSSGGSSTGEEAPPILGGVGPVDSASAQASGSCDPDAGSCAHLGDAGAPSGTCSATGPRDCSSDLDNDCDGQPDNTIDEACVCAAGTIEPCDEHPGLDGRGQCVAGNRTCLLDEATLITTWSGCEGAVSPGQADSCAIAGDDTDCNGTGNGGCPCIDGDTQPCGPATEEGVCQRGIQTCGNAQFGQCVGAVFPAARNCGSSEDNDCDGRPDNTIDNACTCVIGSVRACSAHPGDGNGSCRAGSQTCQGRANDSTSGFGACIGSVGPAPRNCGSQQDNDCDGRPDDTVDSTCQCNPGQGNASCRQDSTASLCNSRGQCVACQQNADCALVTGGRSFCDRGSCIVPPFCGDGIINGGNEVCDGGGSGSTELGSCNPECTGTYQKKFIRMTVENYGSDLGGPSGADGICREEFGQGWKALLVGGARRATVTPFLGDGQQDWVISKYTHYFNAENTLVWRTDSVPLLGVSGGERQNVFAQLFDPGSGIYPWSGYELDWRTQPDDPTTGRGTCQGWTSSDRSLNGTFTLADLTGYAYELCGVATQRLLCVEQ